MTEQQEHPSDVVAARLASFTDEFVEIAGLRAALDAREARLLANAAAYAEATAEAIVPAGTPRAEGQALARRSLCASLAMATRMSEQTLQRSISEAETLVHMAPMVLTALSDGRVSLRHTRVITDQMREVPEASRPAFLDQALALAEHTTAARLTQRARVLRERLHPESIAARAKRSLADRRVDLEAVTDGMAWLHLYTSASIARGVMERLDAVAADARASGDDRTLSQLRADALGALGISGVTPSDSASSAGAASESGTPGTCPQPEDACVAPPIVVEARIRATVQVTVPVLTLLGIDDAPGQLDGYGPIDAETASRLAATAPSMIRVLTHPETGAVLSVGRDQYRVPADLQRVIRLRDATCRAPGCNRRSRDCDLDHSVAWEHGGRTAADNLACLCRHHHRLKHLPGWRLQHEGGGELHWSTPDGRAHITEPDLVDPPWFAKRAG